MQFRRTRAREVALQLLYQHDLNPRVPRADLESFAQGRLVVDKTLVPFCLALFDGVLTHLKTIDQQLTRAAENWRLARMPVLDRNLLRLATFELTHTPETPVAVAINEAVELARRYGSTPDSPGFINGVLDKVRRMTAPRQPAPPADS